jgi:hypothetical protein
VIQISLETIEALPEALRRIVGRERVQRLVGDHLTRKPSGPAEEAAKRASAHPFALDWERLLNEIQQSKTTNQIRFSPDTIFFLDALVSIDEYAPGEIKEELMRKLANRTQYHSTIFEAYIFRQYASRNQKILPVAEDRKDQLRTPDFKVQAGEQTVYIECKSMQDLVITAAPLWNQLLMRLAKKLETHRRSWRIGLRASRWLSGKDIDPLLSALSPFIRDDAPTTFNSGPFEVTCSRLGEYDEIREGDLSLGYDTSPEHFQMGAMIKVENGKTLWSRLILVDGVQHFETDQTRRILSQIDDAYKQIPDGFPGVIHIEIPYRIGEKLLDVADNAYQRVFGYLGKKPRISAVALCARTVNSTATFTQQPIFDYFAVIPNPSARHALPPDFQILGANTQPQLGVESFDSEVGTMYIQFGIHEPLMKQVGRDIIYHCSSDGHYQIRLWQSYSKKFRADIVAPTFGRRTAEADLNHLAVGEVHQLAVTWSREGVRMAVNGQVLESVKA